MLSTGLNARGLGRLRRSWNGIRSGTRRARGVKLDIGGRLASILVRGYHHARATAHGTSAAKTKKTVSSTSARLCVVAWRIAPPQIANALAAHRPRGIQAVSCRCRRRRADSPRPPDRSAPPPSRSARRRRPARPRTGPGRESRGFRSPGSVRVSDRSELRWPRARWTGRERKCSGVCRHGSSKSKRQTAGTCRRNAIRACARTTKSPRRLSKVISRHAAALRILSASSCIYVDTAIRLCRIRRTQPSVPRS